MKACKNPKCNALLYDDSDWCWNCKQSKDNEARNIRDNVLVIPIDEVLGEVAQ